MSGLNSLFPLSRNYSSQHLEMFSSGSNFPHAMCHQVSKIVVSLDNLDTGVFGWLVGWKTASDLHNQLVVDWFSTTLAYLKNSY